MRGGGEEGEEEKEGGKGGEIHFGWAVELALHIKL